MSTKAKLAFYKSSAALWARRAKYRLGKWRYYVKHDPKGSHKRHKWHTLYKEAVDKKRLRQAQAKRTSKKLNASPYEGCTMLDGYPVVNWIAIRLIRARKSGRWTGRVSSGYRTPAHQIEVGTEYARSLGLPVSAVYPGGITASNHCKKSNKPHAGAVDVTQPAQLNAALHSLGIHDLVWGGPIINDEVHFSTNGH